MNVLITGGCGFIGSHLANRFYKEGYDVYIIDNLSTGNINNLSVKCKVYEIDIENPMCEEIFKFNRFDVVIHLAAQASVNLSLENPYLDCKSNILGLINILELSSRYNIKRFIFPSSAAVYGENIELPINETDLKNPISPYGINKYIGEYYCKKWREIYGLNTMCFRFSNVYGPRQGTIGEAGVISTFINKALVGEPLSVYGTGEQTRDFIFVEDVIEAIFKASKTDVCGIMNLSSNIETSLNDLINILKEFIDINEINYEKERASDILKSRLDNTRVKKCLSWDIKYSLKEGLTKTCKWYKYQNRL